MNKIKIKCPAKINLFLDALKKDKNNFHQIKSLFQTISLYDEIIIKKAKKNTIHVNKKELRRKKNIVENVLNYFYTHYKIKEHFDITIKKHIPIGAGLGGGSSDAAGVIWGLSKLLKLKLSAQSLMRIGSQIGKDVPLFFQGGLQLGTHYGEVVKPLTLNKEIYCILIYPGFEISTKESYEKLKREDLNKGNRYFLLLKKAIKTKNYILLCKNLYNIFERNALREYSFLQEIKNDLLLHGAAVSLMSGTGSSVFGLFLSKNDATICKKKLKHKYKDIILCSVLDKGIFTA